MNEKNKSYLIGTVFLIWFFISLGLLLYFANKNGYYLAMVGGQYFLVFGIAHMFSMKKVTIPGICMSVSGIACLIIPYMMLHPEIFGNFNWDRIIVLLVTWTFFVIGLGFIFIPVISKIIKKIKCTVSVEATVIKNETKQGSDGKFRTCPVYEFEYEGIRYEVTKNVYTDLEPLEEQSITNIKINPNNPNEFIDFTDSKDIILILFFIYVGVFILGITSIVLIHLFGK